MHSTASVPPWPDDPRGWRQGRGGQGMTGHERGACGNVPRVQSQGPRAASRSANSAQTALRTCTATRRFPGRAAFYREGGGRHCVRRIIALQFAHLMMQGEWH
jgi:hypothetical protein